MQSFAIIPAAGRSQRMGRPKLLLPWQNSTVIECVVAAWRASQVNQVLIVVHPDDAQLADVARAAGATVVRAPTAPPEMKDSVALGLKHIEQTFNPQPGDAWLLAPADMPGLQSTTIDRLLAAHVAAGDQQPVIWAPISAGRRGHPVLFPWQLAADVTRLAAHEGIDVLVKRNTVRTIAIADSSVFEDLDTPADYRRLGGADSSRPKT